jgi:hypothetical protein
MGGWPEPFSEINRRPLKHSIKKDAKPASGSSLHRQASGKTALYPETFVFVIFVTSSLEKKRNRFEGRNDKTIRKTAPSGQFLRKNMKHIKTDIRPSPQIPSYNIPMRGTKL